jgi:hypothetical protein
MKQKNVYKLALKKETVVNLKDDSMLKIKGGITTIGLSCDCTYVCSRFIDSVCKCKPDE